MNELKVVYMDAGQGDCTLILFPDGKTNWMIDCGSIKNGRTVVKEIEKVLERELLTRGSKIDVLILTHPDQDHYNLLKYFPHLKISEIVYGGHLEQYQNKSDKNYTYNLITNSTSHSPDKQVNWNPVIVSGAQVTFLAANATGSREDTNNNSIATMIDYKGCRFYFMGDAEEMVEEFILTHWQDKLAFEGPVFLKLGHHGSDTSSTERWIKKIRPTAIIASSDTRGFGPNQKGMPAFSKINNIISWSGRIYDKYANHPYVAWCDDADPKYSNYYQKPILFQTTSAVCTTLHNLVYDANYFNFQSTGGSWYFTVNENGSSGAQFSAF